MGQIKGNVDGESPLVMMMSCSQVDDDDDVAPCISGGVIESEC